jgi:16S rRNA (uracil1498-N3)-methyltransferase
MDITGPITVAELVDLVPAPSLAIVCDGEAPPLPTVIRKAFSHQERRLGVLLACGPEGGFDPVELTLIRNAGFQAASLGPNRLRSGTAALAALSIAAATIHELSGGS